MLIRLLQAMGAYGYRGFYERKAHFLQSVPYAIRNLEHLLQQGELPVQVPELSAALQQIVRSTRLREIAPPTPVTGLTVRVGSFSYRLGLPDDPTGHGGGFVFDCRAIDNPGKYPEFADRTGLDPEVVRFLESDTAVAGFFDSVLVLVERQVAVYEGRGFTSLDVQFGCTGGQHRSVYFAERLARAIRTKFPSVRVALEHRERGRWPIATTRAPAPAEPTPSPAGP